MRVRICAKRVRHKLKKSRAFRDRWKEGVSAKAFSWMTHAFCRSTFKRRPSEFNTLRSRKPAVDRAGPRACRDGLRLQRGRVRGTSYPPQATRASSRFPHQLNPSPGAHVQPASFCHFTSPRSRARAFPTPRPCPLTDAVSHGRVFPHPRCAGEPGRRRHQPVGPVGRVGRRGGCEVSPDEPVQG